jgi:protein phosphatase
MHKILILGDVHANLAALDAILDHEGEWDEVLFLGDAVTYGPHPNEVVDRLRTLAGVFIIGNHDRDMFGDLTVSDSDSPDLRWTQWTQQQLTRAHLDFLATFQESCVVERLGYTLRLYHGDRLPLDAALWPNSDAVDFETVAATYPEPHHLTGHVHVQYRRTVGQTEFLNPGGVGQQRLGYPLAFYARLTEAGLTLHAIRYDVEKTCRAMDALPLPRDYIADWQQAFRSGFLPSRYNSSKVAVLRTHGYR